MPIGKTSRSFAAHRRFQASAGRRRCGWRGADRPAMTLGEQRGCGLPAPGAVSARRGRLVRGLWKGTLALATASLLSLSQGPSRAAAQTFSFQSFGQQEGLTNVGITAIAEAPDGRLWIGTQYGLFLFDGVRFTRIPFAGAGESPFVSALFVDRQQRLWFTAGDGLYLRDGSDVRRVSPGSLGFGYGGPPQMVSPPGGAQGVYFTGGDRLRRAVPGPDGRGWRIEDVFSAVREAALPELKEITSLAAAPDGRLWIGCSSAICEDAGGRVRVWGPSQGVPATPWEDVFVDRNGQVWIRGGNHVLTLAPGASAFRREEDGLAPQALDAGTGMFAEDGDGHVLTGLANGFALHAGKVWHSITTRDGFPAEIINVLFVDPQGSVWMGVTGLGLVRWLGAENWEGWTSSDGLSSNNVWSIARDTGGRLWVGTESNLELLRPGTNRFIPAQPDRGRAIRHVLTLLAMPDGRLWSGSGAGTLMAYDPVTQWSSSVMIPKGIFHIFADRAGRIWVCSGDGLWSVNPAPEPEPVVARPAGGPAMHREIFDGAEDPSGALWFVGNDRMFRYDGRAWSMVPLAQGLRVNIFGQVAPAPDGTLWLTVAGRGPVHLRYVNGVLTPIASPAEPQSSSKNVVMLHFDGRGWLWAGTDSGVDVYNGSRWRHFSKQDGLVWDDTDSNAFLSDGDGSIWIGTSGGVAHLLHPEGIFRKLPMIVSLGGSRLGSVRLVPGGVAVFPWKNQAFTVCLSVSNLARAHAAEYHYRLTGLESDWTHTAEAQVRYPSLPPGRYRFEAYATDTDFGARTAVVELPFRILAPWWRRPWFIGLLILAGIGALALLWWWRNRAILERQRYLEKLVEARTRELAELAIRDSLTGLLNRAAIFELLEKEIDRAHRGNGLLAVVLADLDHFKEINDRYGHPAGDAVLASFSRRVECFLRPYDGLGRYGGEEFLILIPGIEEAQLLDRMEELRAAIASERFEWNGAALQLTCSFGLAMLRPGETACKMLIERVDAALYRAKRGGRNRVCGEESPQNRAPVR